MPFAATAQLLDQLLQLIDPLGLNLDQLTQSLVLSLQPSTVIGRRKRVSRNSPSYAPLPLKWWTPLNEDVFTSFTPVFEQADPYYGNSPHLSYSTQGVYQDTFFTVYFNGTYALNGEPIFEAVFFDTAGQWQEITPTAALPYDNGFAWATAEMDNINSAGACPVIAPSGEYQYFGTNGSGGISSDTWLDTANGDGYPNNWQQANLPAHAQPWPSPNFPYSVIFLNAGSAFRTSGGS